MWPVDGGTRQGAALHQFLPTLGPRDAVGNHTLATARALRAAGRGGRIWAEHIHSDLLRQARPYGGYPGRSLRRRRRAHLYQASIGSDRMVEFLLGRPEPLAVYYHNITPPAFFDRYDALAAELTRRGRDELARLAVRTRLALAASEFNAAELRALGMADVRIMLPYTGPGLAVGPDPEHMQRLGAAPRGLDLLFVGRVSPHKGHAHLLRAAAALRAGLDRPVRLFMVGGPGPAPYMHMLMRLRDRLGLSGCAFFTDSIPDSHLAAHYETAAVFVCLSEHEGFCVPLLEAMRFGLPVVAYDAGAVKETLGGSGVLLGGLDPLLVAEVLSRVADDEKLRAELGRRERCRAAELDGFDRDAVLLGAARSLDDL